MDDSTLKLTVERYNGSLGHISVRYETVALKNSYTDAGVVFTPAIPGTDYVYKEGELIFSEREVFSIAKEFSNIFLRIRTSFSAFHFPFFLYKKDQKQPHTGPLQKSCSEKFLKIQLKLFNYC